jgi:uncharacterized protein (TIGR03000 family)
MTAPPAGEKVAPPKEKEKEAPAEKEAAATHAKLTVTLPADAKLYIDNRLMKTASGQRTFSTPTLEPGQLYYYDLRAEVVRDGKTQTQTKRVIVEAGSHSEASFTDLTAPAADKAVATVSR